MGRINRDEGVRSDPDMTNDNDSDQPQPDLERVIVFQTGDEAKILVAKSLLEAEGIDYVVRGEGVQELLRTFDRWEPCHSSSPFSRADC
jgi:hypothetical protein